MPRPPHNTDGVVTNARRIAAEQARVPIDERVPVDAEQPVTRVEYRAIADNANGPYVGATADSVHGAHIALAEEWMKRDDPVIVERREVTETPWKRLP